MLIKARNAETPDLKGHPHAKYVNPRFREQSKLTKAHKNTLYKEMRPEQLITPAGSI